MLRPLPILSASVLFASLLFGGLAYTNSGNPPNATAGAPGESNCSNCHGTASTNPNRFQLSATGGVTSFAPGSRILLRAELLNAPNRKNGFQVAVRNNANTQYGTLEVTDAANTQLSTVGGRQYLKHTSAGNTSSSWNFAWNAPAQLTDTSSVTFYAAGNASNNNRGSDGGDEIFLSRLRIPQRLTSVSERIVDAATVRVFPNPCVEAIHISLKALKDAPVVARLYNTAGIMVSERTFFAQAGTQTLRWKFDQKPSAGTYILRITSGSSATAQRLTVQ